MSGPGTLTYNGIAEGGVSDHRGGLTLVGFGVRSIRTSELPVQVNFAPIVQVRADAAMVPMGTVTTSPVITGPSGNILLAGEEATQVLGQPDVDSPTQMQMLSLINLVVSEHGRHVLGITITIDGQVLQDETGLYVLPAK